MVLPGPGVEGLSLRPWQILRHSSDLCRLGWPWRPGGLHSVPLAALELAHWKLLWSSGAEGRRPLRCPGGDGLVPAPLPVVGMKMQQE